MSALGAPLGPLCKVDGEFDSERTTDSGARGHLAARALRRAFPAGGGGRAHRSSRMVVGPGASRHRLGAVGR